MGKQTAISSQNAIPATVVDGVHYTAVATAIVEPTTTDLSKPAFRTVDPEYQHLLPPDLARRLQWQDEFFDDDDDIVAVFDFDYESMETFYSKVGWCCYGATLLYSPLFTIATLGGVPCFLRRNVKWSVEAQHVAITRDGIRFVRNRRRTCWGLPFSDAGKSSKTIPFDKITDCDIVEPAGNTCLIIENILSTVHVDTASSGSDGKKHELQIAGLRDPHSFKKLVWAMKRQQDGSTANGRAMSAMEMIVRGSTADDGVSSLLREIRDELRQNNALLQSIKPTTNQGGTEPVAGTIPSAPSDPKIV
jgi:hypothetical protein